VQSAKLTQFFGPFFVCFNATATTGHSEGFNLQPQSSILRLQRFERVPGGPFGRMFGEQKALKFNEC
jgi:hypothetical protein